MKKLLNTLYVTSPDAYLSLDGETVAVQKSNAEKVRLPLHNLESIVAFGHTGASPALMGKCARAGIALTFLTSSGRFLARVSGASRGNVVLRREQYRMADDPARALPIAKNCILGKLANSRAVLARALRDHALRLDTERLRHVTEQLHDSLMRADAAESLDALRGLEGEAAARYFSVFDDLVLQQKDSFRFDGRNKRPPTDNLNAMLSFAYTLLAHDIEAALETVGLDAYVGFLHTDRPGRASLALDLMEELRPILADRFVLSLVNKRMVRSQGFLQQENGTVTMDDETRSEFLRNWQLRKQEKLKHPFLDEPVSWGLVPYVQAMLLARCIRGDLDGYPPFLWK